ncbi:uncharacterized protein N7477_000740 [Penicillium maclennaniae]|uniref:uncharacterized protein n=1 Tax=Penicillium maclennaniae TaxID=1343394 RepID=UPI0025409F05|nr:uncharacterized protein N7477_000740 [Penicillium maclennaniae]KAJ5684395.1 hypothetical protein N7477_000740 [Penicillium maclennaniae]
MQHAFYKDNRIVPLGIMLLTFIIFVYHFELDRQGPLGEIPASAVPATFVVESSRQNDPVPYVEYLDTDSKTVNHVAPSAVPSIVPSGASSGSSSPRPQKGLTTDDIVLMFKTGATVLWKRVPIHLATTLSSKRINPNNVLLYSDYPETIGSWEIIDILENTTEKVRNSETFQPYLQQEDYESRQNYAEMSNVPGDAAGPRAAGSSTSTSSCPLSSTQGSANPMPNEKFDHTEPWYLGSLAWIHGDYFAHGGSGFALSRGAWEKSFGKDPLIVERFEEFTEAHGCGDHILGHVLKEYGVQFGETTGDSRFRYGFNPESHWSTWYEQANWCKPVYSWHHTHSKDVARFYNLEQDWDFEKGPLRFRDIYKALVAPYLHSRVEWWDNWSSKYEIKSSVAKDMQPPSTVQSAEVWRSGWRSVDACEAACTTWSECVQWSFYEDRCKMDSMILPGNGIPETDSRRQTSLPWVSGWLPRRVENWECQE